MRMQPLEPRRVRYPRGAYGWIDLKVVTSGVLQEIGSEAAFTYLFLCAVGNMQGVSFWSRLRMAQILGLSLDAVETAIQKLQERDLIAANGKVVQVLPLPALAGSGDALSDAPPGAAPRVSSHRPAATETADTDAGADLDEAEIQPHVAEARRHLAKFTTRVCSEQVRRVARALALEARRSPRG